MTIRTAALALVALYSALSIVGLANADEPIPLHEAVKEGHVKAWATGLGGSTGDAIELGLQRKTSQTLRIVLMPGTIFESATGRVQNMAGMRIKGERVSDKAYRPTSEIVLDDDKAHVFVIEAYCMDFDKPNPEASDYLNIKEPDLRVAEMLSFGSESASMNAIQAALWIQKLGLSNKAIKERFPATDKDLKVARDLLRSLAATRSNASPTERAEEAKSAPQRAPAVGELRTWTDATGKYTTKARFLSVTDGVVSLERESGTVLTVAIERLSEADREYVKQRTAKEER